MEKINFNGLDQDVYNFTLKNGLTVYMVPYKDKKNYYTVLGTKYGSNDIEYIKDNKVVKNPYGVAHFLEHKMFEQEDGEDPFNKFAKTGANSNASTSFYNTRYYVWGASNFYENLDILLDFIFSPYFTEENITKEKGIIKEEILMYNDDPEWALDDNMRKNLFYKLPIKEKISGTVSSIDKITANDLYDIYNTFYNPSNMYLVIGGNINVYEIEKILKKHPKLKSLKKQDKVNRINYDEPDDVKEEYKKIHMNVSVPKIHFAIKVNKDKLKPFNEMEINMYLGVLSMTLFGNTSNFKEEVMTNNLTTGFFGEKSNYDNFVVLSIYAESDKADIFVEKIKNNILNIKVTKEDLERVKKVWIASEIRMIDNLEITVDNIYSDLIQYDKLYSNRIELIKNLNIKDLRKFIKLLDLNNQSLVMILPNE